MPMWDNPPHSCTLYASASSADAAGGTNLSYGSAVQSDIPCLINTASSSERDLFAQQGVTVSHTIGILSAALTVTPVRGMKVTADGASYHVEGIRAGRASAGGSIPAFTYLQVRQLL